MAAVGRLQGFAEDECMSSSLSTQGLPSEQRVENTALSTNSNSYAFIQDQNQEKVMNNSLISKSTGLYADVAITANLVEYQVGSVVSREIIKKPSGTITAFAFDEGQGLSEHTAPFDAIVQILEGEAEITVAGKLFRMKGGEIILLPAGQPHAIKAIKRYKMLLIMIRS